MSDSVEMTVWVHALKCLYCTLLQSMIDAYYNVQNHRMLEVGRDLYGSSSPTPLQINYIWFVSITLNNFKNEARSVKMKCGCLSSVFLTFSDSRSRCLLLQLLHK